LISIKKKGEKELAKKNLSDASEEEKGKASRDYAKGLALEAEYVKAAEASDFKRYKELIEEYEIACEVSGSKKLDRCSSI
jgi:hypothetical protein